MFEEMGIERVGILLSEKDSIVYPNALAPELRTVRPEHVHRVRDYTGATKEERKERVQQIIAICKEKGYGSVFAGYGFMAEDGEFVRALEDAGLNFVGPGSRTQFAAGQKDEAKRTAQTVDVSTTPGTDDVTTRTVLALYPSLDAMRSAAAERGFDVDLSGCADDDEGRRRAADDLLAASQRAGVDIFTIDQLGAQVAVEVGQLLEKNPGRRIRLKAVGSGGGKGQRILPAPTGDGPEANRVVAEQAPDLLRQVLTEVKATGAGDNKNVLLEVNIETTRHHEIQLVGNGTWCIALGGRDCSLQMHEQKLLEISITREGLKRAIDDAQAQGRPPEVDALRTDLHTLESMEAEAERFGVAVGLDSASTFESIVDGADHYFMEMNTRIQVEHRVSELCYALRFTNPDDPEDHFDVTSLVEAMVLVSRHGARLPRPTRIIREGAAVEARLNATDRSLSPHAGGTIINWSDPHPHEVRDDQGISIKNPDTGQFMWYRLAGAYDSNIALIVTAADDRRASLERLSDILRVTKLRGSDLATNLDFHYGLVEWLLAQGPYARVTTAFIRPYLSVVGSLAQAAAEVEPSVVSSELSARYRELVGPDPARQKSAALSLAEKETLVSQPLLRLLGSPHIMSGWLSRFADRVERRDGRIVFARNPLRLVADTYVYLNMDYRPDLPAAHCVWDHDAKLLARGLAFYEGVYERLQTRDWARVQEVLASADRPDGVADPDLWDRVRGAHAGWQAGLESLAVLFALADAVGFYELTVSDDLAVHIPERFKDPALYERMRKVLSPPPRAKADEIVAVSGGMFYAREAPDRPPLIEPGDHFERGQPLYIVEVMKMFNKVVAEFSGTIDEILVDGSDGTVVAKGQPLFRVTPDDREEVADPNEEAERKRRFTLRLLDSVSPAYGSARA